MSLKRYYDHEKHTKTAPVEKEEIYLEGVGGGGPGTKAGKYAMVRQAHKYSSSKCINCKFLFN